MLTPDEISTLLETLRGTRNNRAIGRDPVTDTKKDTQL
jgi:hypothetical protein